MGERRRNKMNRQSNLPIQRSTVRTFKKLRTNGLMARIVVLGLMLFALGAILGAQLLWAAPARKLEMLTKVPESRPAAPARIKAAGGLAPLMRQGQGDRLAPTVAQVLCVGSGATGSPCTNPTPFASI